jgi:hypothetical protein
MGFSTAGAASGAATGATFGPWGAAVGGVLGGFMGDSEGPSSSFAQGGVASINASGWVVGKGNATGGGFPWGIFTAGVLAVFLIKKYKGR